MRDGVVLDLDVFFVQCMWVVGVGCVMCAGVGWALVELDVGGVGCWSGLVFENLGIWEGMEGGRCFITLRIFVLRSFPCVCTAFEKQIRIFMALAPSQSNPIQSTLFLIYLSGNKA